MAKDQELEIHRAWLGPLQPVGLVVSPSALVAAQAFPDRDMIARQQALAEVCDERRSSERAEPSPCIVDFPTFTQRVLDWTADDLVEADNTMELVLPDYGETLRADQAVVDSGRPLLLVKSVPIAVDLDATPRDDHDGWRVSPHEKFERLLRGCGISAGLLCNGHNLRLVYAPRGETAGHLTFPVPAMLEVSGRPLLAAMHMLLGADRVFSAPDGRRLLDILAVSRRYQSEVSTRLAGQVLGALWELLRGFQAADEAAEGKLLPQTRDGESDDIYGGLLTVLLRLVFLLYAEDKGLMPDDAVYVNNYSVSGLYLRLRDDAGRWPDTMDQRYGAWAWLLSLFRLVHDGGGHGEMSLPPRHGQLFDPTAFKFLGGTQLATEGSHGIPRVSDGCIYRVLDSLVMLDGERLSYGALDVEQLGSVYEAMMGFAVERAVGLSIGVRSDGAKPGAVRADPIVDVEALLAEKPAERKKWLQNNANCELSGKDASALQAAKTPEDVVAALGRKLSRYTLHLIPRGGLYLQPTEERRRSGSHYTPRELTEPIVRTTLRPVLEALGERPAPEQILDLKVCDPAMGSGAFLVETCRQVAEKLVETWTLHDCQPPIPGDEDPLLHARRLVAQRCLYGVDKNPFAVNLAKLSLWLVTLARDHAFTFLNHALKCGDSLVGLTREQIEAFHWKEPKRGEEPLFAGCDQWVDVARDDRVKLAAIEDERESEKVALLEEADRAVDDLRLAGDLIVAAFFAGKTDKDREAKRLMTRARVDEWRNKGLGRAQLVIEAHGLRDGRFGVKPFHWDVEFPEVVRRRSPGFDAIVGNPPFLGGSKISSTMGERYLCWVLSSHNEAHGNADLVAHFFYKAFHLVRRDGAFGLIATNTIRQGDTRATGLRQICRRGGQIFQARRRVEWPGLAAVVVSVVHVFAGQYSGQKRLDDRVVDRINAFLFHRGGDDDPIQLSTNRLLSFAGNKVYGQGFTFDDTDTRGSASPITEMKRLLQDNPSNSAVISPYVGGEELNNSPTHEHHRFVIDFRDREESECRERWPELMCIVERKVKPERMMNNREGYRRYWWQHGEKRVELYRAIAGLSSVLALSSISKHHAIVRLSPSQVFSHNVTVISLDAISAFSILQSRVHEEWVRFTSSTLEDRLGYRPTDCFETFPFPPNWQSEPTLEASAHAYYEFRADLILCNNEGLTKTYNRFHDPDERSPDILRLRELHTAMDRAVLDAYGWHDIPTDCQFLLDYEIDEETWGTKKKPWRYRWPEEVHDEVLARLLDLNQKRAEEERITSLDAASPKKKRTQSGKHRKNVTDLSLFASELE